MRRTVSAAKERRVTETKGESGVVSLIATITLKGANLSSALGATSQSHTSNHTDCNKFPKAPLIPWNMTPDATGVSGLLSWRGAGSARRTFHVCRFSFLFLFFPAETRLGTIWNFNNQTRKIKAEKCLGYCEADVFRIVRPIQSCCRHGNNTVERSATTTTPPTHTLTSFSESHQHQNHVQNSVNSVTKRENCLIGTLPMKMFVAQSHLFPLNDWWSI